MLALLASGALFRGGGASAGTTTGSQPTSDEGAGGLLGGLGGLLDKLQKGGLADMVINSWVGSGQNQPVSPKQLSTARWATILSRRSLSEQAFRKKS
jgi:uncharacterized protein YidB (DUF937 family)